jgi:hypothetical protein
MVRFAQIPAVRRHCDERVQINAKLPTARPGLVASFGQIALIDACASPALLVVLHDT